VSPAVWTLYSLYPSVCASSLSQIPYIVYMFLSLSDFSGAWASGVCPQQLQVSGSSTFKQLGLLLTEALPWSYYHLDFCIPSFLYPLIPFTLPDT
jgi:hypothetical protein